MFIYFRWKNWNIHVDYLCSSCIANLTRQIGKPNVHLILETKYTFILKVRYNGVLHRIVKLPEKAVWGKRYGNFVLVKYFLPCIYLKNSFLDSFFQLSSTGLCSAAWKKQFKVSTTWNGTWESSTAGQRSLFCVFLTCIQYLYLHPLWIHVIFIHVM